MVSMIMLCLYGIEMTIGTQYGKQGLGLVSEAQYFLLSQFFLAGSRAKNE